MNNQCPPECKKDLKHLSEADKRIEKENADQWDKINEATKCAKAALAEAMSRVRPAHAITALGILVAVMLAGFKVIYSQNALLVEDFGKVKERIVAVETKLDMFQRDHSDHYRNMNERHNNKRGAQ